MQGKATLLLGPIVPGVITPDELKIGIMPGHIHKQGRIGVILRSGTLTVRGGRSVDRARAGPVDRGGHRGDPVNGLKHLDVLKLFNDDPGNRRRGHDRRDRRHRRGNRGALGEGQHEKSRSSASSQGSRRRPASAWATPGAIISGGKGTAQEKLAVMEECGIRVTRNPAEMGKLLQSVL
jgi:succinyl-CoA synthetase alpha subunit